MVNGTDIIVFVSQKPYLHIDQDRTSGFLEKSFQSHFAIYVVLVLITQNSRVSMSNSQSSIFFKII